MAQVPYSPTPTVEEHATPVGPMHIDAGPDMFGASVGRALQQAGGTIENSSNEVFARAIQLQNVQNAADANQASANYDQQAGLLHAKFSSLEGSNAGPDALAAHEKELQDLRTQTGAGLNPAAQKMYDQSSLSTMGRTIFNAAGHSGEQMKQYYVGGLQANMKNADDNALSNPTDELSFNAALSDKANAARAFAQAHGWGDDQTNEYVRQQQSSLIANRITGLARQNPAAANDMFKKAMDDGSLRGQEIAGVQRTVDSQMMAGGAKQIADGTRDGSLGLLGQGKVDINRAADAIAGIESGGSYTKLGPVITKGMYAGQQALGKYQVMPGNLPQWLRDSGLPQMTPAQFIANPAAQEQLFKVQFGKLTEQYGNSNDAASVWLTGHPVATAGNRADADGTTSASYVQQFNANLAKTATLQQKVDAARSAAEKANPELPLLGDAAEQQVLSQHRQEHAIANEQQKQLQDTLSTALSNLDGKTPTSFNDWVNSDPQLANAWQGMDGKARVQFQKNYNTAITHDNTPSVERDAARKAMIGLSYSDPEKFQNTNMYGQDLTEVDRKAIISIQSGMTKGTPRDTHVNDALKTLGTQLTAAGLLDEGKPNNRDDYNTFVGGLHDQLATFQRTHARPPNDSEVRDIGNRLLTSTVTQAGRFWGTNQVPVYQVQPPADYIATMRKQYPTASDDQIRQRFVRDQYRLAVGKEANAQH